MYKTLFVLTVFSVFTLNVFGNFQNFSIGENDSEGVFGPLLEQWALRPNNNREQRVMQLPPTEGGFVASRVVVNETRPPGKIVTKPSSTDHSNHYNQAPSREVSETDLYLLGAIEKLVFKVDLMEKRIRKLEEVLSTVVAGGKIDTIPCPESFVRIGEGCYYISERQFDWQVASKWCRRLGAPLTEFETDLEKRNVVDYLRSNLLYQGNSFWTGGLNPGLLWIWSGSAKPVITTSNGNSSDIRGMGRCLGLSYEAMYKIHMYRGQDCATKQYFICEQPDFSSENAIARIRRQLIH